MMSDEVLHATWVRFIPALPLLAALIHGLMIGVFRRSLSTRIAGMISVGSVIAALIFSVLAFADLIGQDVIGATAAGFVLLVAILGSVALVARSPE